MVNNQVTRELNPQELIDFIDSLQQGGQLDDEGVKQVMNYIISDGSMTGKPRDLILMRRGPLEKLPRLSLGELAFTTDTQELYVGGYSGNVNVTKGGTNAVYNVANFGAVGDGVTDDTEAFRKLFNKISQDPTFKRVEIPAGTYIISGTFGGNIYNTTFVGEGACLKVINNSPNIEAIIQIGDSYNVSFNGITFDGNSDNQSGDKNTHHIHVIQSKNVTVNNCTFKNGYGDMLVFANCKYPIVDNCIFDKTVSSTKRDFMGLLIISNLNEYREVYGTVTNNLFKDITFDGVTFSGQLEIGFVASHCLIANNTFQNVGNIKFDTLAPEQDAAAIYIQWANDVIIDGNILEGTYGNGIDVYVGGNVVITNNIVSKSGNAGISVEGADEAVITGNICRDNVTKGRTGINVEYGLLAGITIKAPYANVVISGNISTDTRRVASMKTQEYGIYLWRGAISNITITDNNLVENKVDGIYWEVVPLNGNINNNAGFNPRAGNVITPPLPSANQEVNNPNPYPVMIYTVNGLRPQIGQGGNFVPIGDSNCIYLPTNFKVKFQNPPNSWQWFGL